MAYSGLPSKACANCRTRRIKCNQLEPACSQCRRAGKECPGYRDELSLIFRDENSKVIRRAQARMHAAGRQQTRVGEKSHQAQSDERPTTTFEGLAPLLSPSPSLMLGASSSDMSLRRLSSPVEYQAINFFFHHYLSSCLSAQRAPLDISIWPFWHEVSENKHFLDAVSSVGLAGLANVKKSQPMMKIARMKYASTLQRVMAAVQNPAQADLVHTIKAVMTLALFELVDCSPETAGSWRAHIGGAIALLRSGQFHKLQGLAEDRMKIQFCYSIFVNCVDTGERLPPTIAVWSRLWGASLAAHNAPGASLAAIVIRYVELHASIKARDICLPSTIIHEALQLDAALQEWRANLPSSWHYITEVSTDDPEMTFNGHYHIYQDFWIERMWDHYRWVRILVHELLLLTPTTPSSLSSFSRSTSLATISHLAADICTSVASVLYRLAPQPPSDPAQPTPPPRVGGVFMILWTLRIAGGAVGTDEGLYQWVVGMLAKIGQTMGILQTRIAIGRMGGWRAVWKGRFEELEEERRVDVEKGYGEGWERDVERLSDFGDLD